MYCGNNSIALQSQKIIIDTLLNYLVKIKMESYLSDLNCLLKTAKREKLDYAIAFLTGALMSFISLAVMTILRIRKKYPG